MKHLKRPEEAVQFVFALSCLKSKHRIRPGLPAAVTGLTSRMWWADPEQGGLARSPARGGNMSCVRHGAKAAPPFPGQICQWSHRAAEGTRTNILMIFSHLKDEANAALIWAIWVGIIKVVSGPRLMKEPAKSSWPQRFGSLITVAGAVLWGHRSPAAKRCSC